jgi:hypothetical protein
MIKIYDGEVFAIDMQSYDRMKILQDCWERSDCSKLKFLLYDDGRIIGSASYYNILYDEITVGIIQMDREKIFQGGREFFYSGNPREEDCVPVLDENGNCCFLLVYYVNKSFDTSKNGLLLDNYEDLDLRLDAEYLDYSLISECDNILFWELEEYTFEIACLVKEVFPQKEVAFLDDNAELFFDDITILDTVYETKMRKGKWLFVSSERKSRFTVDWDSVTLFYNSLKVINSLLWCRHIDTYGDKNADKIFYLIDVSCGGAGLSDIMQYVCTHTLLARRRGWIPYVLLNTFPNQYLKDKNDNMWEYYFKNVSEVSIEEIMQSKHVICASHNAVVLDGAYNNPYINELRQWLMMSIHADLNVRKRSADKNYFKKIVKLNAQLEKAVKTDVPWDIDGKMKILGVIVRGTDYTSEAVKARESVLEVKLPTVANVIRKIKEIMTSWGYDYCFVATEDKNVFHELKENLGTKMLYIEQERVEYENGSKLSVLTEIYQQNHIDTYELGKKYLSVLYALSICDGLLSNIVCGATFIARSWNNGNYKLDEVVDY